MYLYRSAKHAQTSRDKELLSSSGPADVEHSLALTFAPLCWILKTPAWVCSSNFWSCAWSCASFRLNPLGNRIILFLFLGQELLGSENLVRRHVEKQSGMTVVVWLLYWTYCEKFIAILSECYKNESLNNFALNIINIAFFLYFLNWGENSALCQVNALLLNYSSSLTLTCFLGKYCKKKFLPSLQK